MHAGPPAREDQKTRAVSLIGPAEIAAWTTAVGAAVGVPVTLTPDNIPVPAGDLPPTTPSMPSLTQQLGVAGNTTVIQDKHGDVLCLRPLDLNGALLGTLCVGPMRLADAFGSQTGTGNAPFVDAARVGAILDLAANGILDRVRARRNRDRAARKLIAARGAMRAAENRLQRIAAQIPGVVYQFRMDKTGRIAFPSASEGISDICGMAPDAIRDDATPVIATLHPDDRDRVLASIEHSARTMTIWWEQFRVAHPTKGQVWVEGHSKPERWPDGSIVWHGLLVDITHRVTVEQRLREREELYHSVIVNAHDGFWLMGNDGHLIEVNDAYLRMTGFSREDLLGQIPDFMNAAENADETRTRTADLRRNRTGLFQARHRTASGATIDVEVSASYTDIDGGRFFVFIRDITDRKQAEATALAAKAAAEQANRAKSEFLAAMSHDLRTPLNAIIGFADIMRLGTFGPIGSPRYHEYVENICSSGALLVSLVNDVLDLSKIESGKYDLLEQDLDLPWLMGVARQHTAVIAAERGQTVLIAHPPDLPHLLGDERALLQVLTNLLSNAVKFNHDEGKVELTAGLENTGRLWMQVADQGIGMTDAQIESVLRPFDNANSQVARPGQGGAGLGLYLSAKLIDLFGGRLTVDSAPDAGTTVTIVFPPERTIPPRPRTDGDTPRRPRILFST